MTISVFIGTSVDGFIARLNGDLDFLPAGGGEPHGYNDSCAPDWFSASPLPACRY
jgi:hypothetical protein